MQSWVWININILKAIYNLHSIPKYLTTDLYKCKSNGKN